MLPELSGLEVTRQIRAEFERPDRDAHGAGRGGRQGRRAGARRRRLRHEAVQLARAVGADPRRAPARRARPARRCRPIVDLGRSPGRPRRPPGPARRRARSRSSRRSSTCWRSSSATPARSSAATSSSSRSGATTTPARRGRSTSTSTGCARRSSRRPPRRRSSRRSAAWATCCVDRRPEAESSGSRPESLTDRTSAVHLRARRSRRASHRTHHIDPGRTRRPTANPDRAGRVQAEVEGGGCGRTRGSCGRARGQRSRARRRGGPPPPGPSRRAR